MSAKTTYEVVITFDSGTGEFHLKALDVNDADAQFLDMNYICRAVAHIANNVLATLDDDQQATTKGEDDKPTPPDKDMN